MELELSPKARNFFISISEILELVLLGCVGGIFGIRTYRGEDVVQTPEKVVSASGKPPISLVSGSAAPAAP